MTLKDSQIIHTALTKLFPFALLFSMYVFSYSGVFPGGGFQAGVVIGTLVVIIEMSLERKLHSDNTFEYTELAGVLVLGLLLLGGIVLTGYPFGGFYVLQGTSQPLANVMIWLLSFAIFLEVAGSMVLIFRGFLFWESGDELYLLKPGPAEEKRTREQDAPSRRKELSRITWISAFLIAAAVIIVVILFPTPEAVFHAEVDDVRRTTQDFGIRNMVSTVYLGPRIIDTFLEVMVVVLTVFGVTSVRRAV